MAASRTGADEDRVNDQDPAALEECGTPLDALTVRGSPRGLLDGRKGGKTSKRRNCRLTRVTP